MTDLADFLNARLGGDEAAAEAATSGAWHPRQHGTPTVTEVRFSSPDDMSVGTRETVNVETLDDDGWSLVAGDIREDDAAHIARHGPARVLREVAAKRAIVRWHPSEAMRYIEASRCPQCELPWPCPTVRLIAAVYSDHPDYRQEWAAGG